MKPNLSKKVVNKIEELCAQGCTQVNQLLEDVNNGKNIVEQTEFSASEIKQIIDELFQIMSVYKTNNNDSDDNDSDTGFK